MNMHRLPVSVLVFFLLPLPITLAEKPTKLELNPEKMDLFDAKGAEKEFEGKKALHLKMIGKTDGGVAFFKDMELSDGIIEVDIAAEKFAGLAFRGKDGKHYEQVYFRPFNSGTPKHKNTVQYASRGIKGGTWQALRKKSPGKYEAGADMAKWGWFRARIIVSGQQVKVFVNDAKEPVLVVERMLGDRTTAKLGIWAWEAYFANFSFTKLPSQSTRPACTATQTQSDA